MKTKIALAVALSIAAANAYAVNYGEPGHNPGNPGNPGVGGPPVSNPGNGTPGGGNGYVVNVYPSNAVSVVGGNPSADARANAGAIAGATASSTSSSISSGGAGGEGGQGGAATVNNTVNVQPSSGSGAGGSGTINHRYSGEYKVKALGVAPSFSTNTTAGCIKNFQASGGWFSGLAGFNLPINDTNCVVWADYARLMDAGYIKAANNRLCDDSDLSKLLDHCQRSGETNSASSGGLVTSGFKH